MNFRILIVDDEEEICCSLAELLEEEGYLAHYCLDPQEVAAEIAQNRPDLIIMDLRMPVKSGIDLIKELKRELTGIPVIMISGYASTEHIVRAMKYGAVNFYTKPIDNRQLLREIGKLASSKRSPAHAPRREILTQNGRMQKILSNIELVAPTNAAVIITGESGTGKELVADALHTCSGRTDHPYVKLNCAAIPETLLESELFGHERGAFTDAKERKAGKFEIADKGTIFLDEIGDMSLKTQAKMLRVLQEKKFSRIGGTTELHTDCRIIAATNKDLKEMIAGGEFRQDLYYRISVVNIKLPPLRERKDDVLLLAEHFLALFCADYAKNITSISDEVKAIMLAHDWPGNIRELKNFIERAVIFSSGDTLGRESIPDQYESLYNARHSGSLEQKYETLTRNIIIEALERSDNVKLRAAKMLNIDRKTLYNKMKKFNLI